MDLLERFGSFNRDWETFEDLYNSFTWDIPSRFNIGQEICDQGRESLGHSAIQTVGLEQPAKTYTFNHLDKESNLLAHYFADVGVERGDRVAIHTIQRPETVVAHLAAWKLGAVSVVLNPLVGCEEMISQLVETDTKVCILDPAVFDPPSGFENYVDSLSSLLFFGDTSQIGQSYTDAITGTSAELCVADTSPDDDAVIVYTSGTTGTPKGVIHTHSTLIGHLPTYYLTFTNLNPEASQIFWTVSNWASITLMSNVITPLFAGRTVIAHARTARFDPEEALRIVTDCNVTNLSASPTALRMIRQLPHSCSQYGLDDLHIITTGGEEVSDSLINWWANLDVTVQEVYGQTEANNIVADCDTLLTGSANAVGRPMPGHEIAILDPENPESQVDTGEIGEIAVLSDDPICFDRYWNNPGQTTETVQKGWLLTGDLGFKNSAGELFFKSRKDDVIITSGHRIGPAEIEEVLVTHPAVIDAGVIGITDDIRGEIPKAFVELREDVYQSNQLVTELQEYVKNQAAKYKYPREIEFLESIPKTNTGTIARGKLREITSK